MAATKNRSSSFWRKKVHLREQVAQLSQKILAMPLLCSVIVQRKKVFRYLTRFTRDSRVWRTDRRTYSIIENAALHYVMPPKNLWTKADSVTQRFLSVTGSLIMGRIFPCEQENDSTKYVSGASVIIWLETVMLLLLLFIAPLPPPMCGGHTVVTAVKRLRHHFVLTDRGGVFHFLFNGPNFVTWDQIPQKMLR